MRKEIFHLKEEQQLGTGKDKKVYQDPENPNRVIKVYKAEHVSPDTMKFRFYATKIAHLLFPENIPDVLYSATSPNVIIRERKELDPEHAALQKLKIKKSNGTSYAELEEALSEKYAPARKALKEKLEGAGFIIDRYPANYTFGPQGDLQYLEEVEHCDLGTLEQFIMKLDEQRKEKVLVYFERIKKLESYT